MILEAVQMLYTAHWAVAYPFLEKCRSPIALSKCQKELIEPPSLVNWEAPPLKSNLDQNGFRPVHINHPCTRWVRASKANYLWLCRLALALADENRHRWPASQEHSCAVHARWLAAHPPALPDLPLTQFALAMPDEYKRGDPIVSYRAFYRGSKQERGITDRYTRRHKPHWL